MRSYVVFWACHLQIDFDPYNLEDIQGSLSLYYRSLTESRAACEAHYGVLSLPDHVLPESERERISHPIWRNWTYQLARGLCNHEVYTGEGWTEFQQEYGHTDNQGSTRMLPSCRPHWSMGTSQACRRKCKGVFWNLADDVRSYTHSIRVSN